MRTLATKNNRLEIQNFEFTNLINKGYSREDYGDLKIFKMIDNTSTWLKTFRGTATKEIIYKRCRTEALAIEAINDAKASHDRRKAYKAELKANPTKSSSANCAAAIREELKKEFAGVKFKVTSQNFSGGDSVQITWSDGPTVGAVEDVTKKYQYGSFDGMTDSYECTNRREDLPQSKYVQTHRDISEEINNTIFDALRLRLSTSSGFSDSEVGKYVYRIINKTSIPLGATVTGITEVKDRGVIEDCFGLSFLLAEGSTPEPKETPKETPNFEAVEVPAGEVQIVDYSAKAIAVIGETKPIKDKLKEIGGKFNFRLSCGPGWIFSKKHLLEVQKLLSGGDQPEATEEPEEKTTLKDEISKTINFLADLDVKIYGEVSESVHECARVQEVEINNSLDDINEAEEGGKVRSFVICSN